MRVIRTPSIHFVINSIFKAHKNRRNFKAERFQQPLDDLMLKWNKLVSQEDLENYEKNRFINYMVGRTIPKEKLAVDIELKERFKLAPHNYTLALQFRYLNILWRKIDGHQLHIRRYLWFKFTEDLTIY